MTFVVPPAIIFPIIKSSDLVPSSSDPGLCPFPALGPDDLLELVRDA